MISVSSVRRSSRERSRLLRFCFVVLLCASVSRDLASCAARDDLQSTENEECKKLEKRLEAEQGEAENGWRTVWAWIDKCQPEVNRWFIMTSEMTLGRLGYGIGPFDGELDEKSRSALRAYQKKAGLPVTGQLSSETFDHLNSDGKSLDSLPVHLAMFRFLDGLWNQYVSAEGTWVIENEAQGIPLQSSQIECYRSWMRCIQSTAEISPGDWPTLSANIELHDVERWDAHEIITKPDDKACVRYTMRLSRDQKSVTALRSTISQSEGCKGLVENRDLRLRLEDGLKVWNQLNDKLSDLQRRLVQADWSTLEAAKRAFEQLDLKRQKPRKP